MADGSSWKRDPFSRRDAMMMKRRFQVKMGAQQYHQNGGHARDIQTRSDRELVFLLQKDPTQRTVHVSHFQFGLSGFSRSPWCRVPDVKTRLY